MHTLSPLFASVVMGNGVGAGDISSITTLTPPLSTGRTGGVDSSTVVAALDQVLSCIIDSITHAPMWLRCVCQHVFTVTCTSDDRGRARYACGGVLLLCGFCPAISNPEKFGLLPASVTVPETCRQILRGISRALTILANGYDVNSVDDGFMSLIRPSLETAMPQYLSFLDQLMCSQHPAQVSSLLPPIKMWRSQREDVSIVMRFADRHAHRLRKSLAMRGHRRELLVLRHLLRAPRDALPTLEPSPVFLAARPSMSNPGAMQWASLQLVQPRSSAPPPRSRRSAVAHGVAPQPVAPSPVPQIISSNSTLPAASTSSVRSMTDASANSVSSSSADEVGVGIEVEVSPNGRVSVRRLENGGPAQRCGAVEVGDDIVAVDGRDIASVPNPMSVSARYLFGTRGSRVTITLRRRGSSHTHSVTLLRNSPYNMHHLEATAPPPVDTAADSSVSSNSSSSKIYASTTSPKSLRFADGTATSDGHGGAPKRLRTCGVSFTKSNGVYVVKRARASVIVPETLKPGMQLLQVDGTSVVDLTEADVMQLLLGPDGSMCSLTLQNPLMLSETITISLPRSYKGGSKDGNDASEDSDACAASARSASTTATLSSAAPSTAEAKPHIPSSSSGLKSVYENLSLSLIGAATGRPSAPRQGVQQVGIGVSFVPAPDGSGFVISKILPGSAASRSALAAGDYVVTIDGSSVGGIDLNGLRALITGDVDSVASIGYRQQGSGSVKQVKIKRATLDPLVMAAMSSQQSFSSTPAITRSHSPQSGGAAAIQSLYSPSQSPVPTDSLQQSVELHSGSARAVPLPASVPLSTEAAPVTQASNGTADIAQSTASAAVAASAIAASEHRDADEEWSGSESSGYASGMGVLSEADGDGSDDDFGAAPLLQSPSKEMYQHSHHLHLEHVQHTDLTRLDQNVGNDVQQPPRQHEDEHKKQATWPAELEPPQQQQQQHHHQLKSSDAQGHLQQLPTPPEDPQPPAQDPERQQQHQQKTMHEQEHVRILPVLDDHLRQRQTQQDQEQQQTKPFIEQGRQGLSQHVDYETNEDGVAAKFVFIASFGLTLCEDGRGYWYISAKVGENRLPALVIGDVIRTVSDTTARGWGADRMCASLDKGGVEIGIQRGLTAAMRFVTLPSADMSGLHATAAPVTRHGLGFAFKRNEDSGALIVSCVRDGSAAASCRCLEVGDILLEVSAI
jgi:C-terminal processing protease CtpA/Prc